MSSAQPTPQADLQKAQETVESECRAGGGRGRGDLLRGQAVRHDELPEPRVLRERRGQLEDLRSETASGEDHIQRQHQGMRSVRLKKKVLLHLFHVQGKRP